MTLWNTEKSFFGAVKLLNTGWYLIREIKRINFNYFNSVQKRGFFKILFYFLLSVLKRRRGGSGQNASAWLNRIQIASRYVFTEPAVLMNLTWRRFSKKTKLYWQWNCGSDKFWRCSDYTLRTFRILSVSSDLVENWKEWNFEVGKSTLSSSTLAVQLEFASGAAWLYWHFIAVL